MRNDCIRPDGRAWLLLITALMVFAAAGRPVTAEGGEGAEFWVSPAGSDSGAGTREEPFRTLERARDAIRALEPARRAGDVVVYLRGGDHRLARTFELDWRDSGAAAHGVTYRAAPGEAPILRGSVAVDGWLLHDPARRVYRAVLDAARFGPHPRSRQLYVDGRRAVRARTDSPGAPAYPTGFRASYPAGIEYVSSPLNPAAWRDPAAWRNPGQVEAVMINQWKITIVPLYAVVPPLGPQSLLRELPGKGMLVLRDPGWTNANSFVGTDGAPGLWSFWRVSRFENAYEFLDEPGEFYLDETENALYYLPRPGEDLDRAKVELPLLEVLLDGRGERDRPIENLRFEGLTFAGATWLAPSGDNGYVSDQSGFHLVGRNPPSANGHYPNPARTPGNLRFRYARNVAFAGNIFENLGAVALDFDTGSQGNRIESNLFEDISSAAIQLGGIAPRDHHPEQPQDLTRDNVIAGNLILQAGREFVDAAGIFVGFTRNTLIEGNTLAGLPWSGIAVGWGWGLLDPGSFLGLPGAKKDEWGHYDQPTASNGNRILDNWIQEFVQVTWDGGAVYTTGQQGHSPDPADALQVAGNVAILKRPQGGSNVLYTDGGTRYVHLEGNLLAGNPTGSVDFGPRAVSGDPLVPAPPWTFPYYLLDGLPYGSDRGGCRTYGHLRYVGNYWEHPDFFDPCPYSADGQTYPVDLELVDNHLLGSSLDLPIELLAKAGAPRQPPPAIPAGRWLLPSAAAPATAAPQPATSLKKDLKRRLRGAGVALDKKALGNTKLGYVSSALGKVQ